MSFERRVPKPDSLRRDGMPRWRRVALHGVAWPSGSRYTGAVKLTVEFDRETDGRWIASVPELAGVHVYGETREQALAKVLSLAYSVLAEEVEQGERDAETLMSVTFDTREAA
jgi:predicted RNase H-like HicB family nuclease